MLALVGGTAAYGSLTSETITACYKPANGALYLIGGESQRSECMPNDLAIEWNVQGPIGPQGEQGPPGEQGRPGEDGADGAHGQDGEDFAGTFTSPNGEFSLSVDNAGARIEGPNGRILLGNDGIRLEGVLGSLRLTTSETALRSTGALRLQSGGTIALSGAQVALNGAGCSPAARQRHDDREHVCPGRLDRYGLDDGLHG